MKDTKPVGVDITIEIVCPHCQYRWWFTLHEMRASKWSFQCACNDTIHIEPINSVVFDYKSGPEVVVSLSKKTKKKKKKKKKKVGVKIQQEGVRPVSCNTEEFPGVVVGLVSLGSTKTEAKRKVALYIKQTGFCGTEDELMTKILKETS